MNTKHRILLAGSTAVALALTACATGPKSARSEPATVNEAVADSPRYIEKHPGTRQVALSPEETQAEDAQIEKQHAKLMENSAIADSPRHLEKYPQMLRVPTSWEEAQDRDARDRRRLVKRMANEAWANSPRAREEFPEIVLHPMTPEEKQSLESAPDK